MTGLALALALSAQASPPPPMPAWYGGRLYTAPELHVGLRPAAFLDNEDHGRLEVGVGVTLQVTTRW